MRFFAFIILIALSVKSFECIVRGRDAVINKYPYVVKMKLEKLTRRDDFVCGAAVIDESWLLTAAHCFDEIVSVKVYLGSTFNNLAERIYSVPFSDIIVHPDFDINSAGHDIALIKIPRTPLSKEIAIVPLPKRSNFRYTKTYAKACGWGKTSTHASVYSPRLQCGRLEILNKIQCRHPFVNKDTKNIICTAVSSNLASPCMGDAGGPLVSEKTGELIGIISMGDLENCEDGYTPISTQVAGYLDWIETVSGIAS